MEKLDTKSETAVHTVFGGRPAAERQPKPFKPPPPPPIRVKKDPPIEKPPKEYAVKGKRVPKNNPWYRGGRVPGAKNLTRVDVKEFEVRAYTPQAYRAVVVMFREGLSYDEVLARTNLHPHAIDAICGDYKRSSKIFNEQSAEHAKEHARRCVECRHERADFCRSCAETMAGEPEVLDKKSEPEVVDRKTG